MVDNGHPAIQPGYPKPTLPNSKHTPLDLAQVLICMMGMAVPVVFGVVVEKAALGVSASFGAMLVSGAAFSGTMRQQLLNLTRIMLAGSVALLFGKLIGGYGPLTGGLIITTSFLSALLGGISRSVAQVSKAKEPKNRTILPNLLLQLPPLRTNGYRAE